MVGTAVAKAKAMDGLSELPAGWEWVQIGEDGLTEIIMGQSPPGTSYNSIEDGLPFFQGKAEFGDLYPTAAKWCNDPRKIACPGDVLISVRAPVGPTNLAQEKCCIGRGLAAISPSKYLFNRYLLYALRAYEPELSTRGRGSTFSAINKTELSAISIPLPFPHDSEHSIDVQHRIVARIEALQAEVKKARGILKQMRRDSDRMMNAALKALVDRLPPHRIPLIEVIESKPRNGWSPKCDNNPNGIPVLKLGAVLWFRYNPNEFKRTSEPVDHNAHYWLQPGDILISRSNTPQLVGHASIYTGNPSPCIYPDLLMRMRVRTSEANPNFLLYWLQTKEVRNHINSRASGASPTMKKIKQQDVCSIPFPRIDVNDQLYWATYLDSIQSGADKLSGIINQDAKLLDQLEQSILERAFRGEL